MPLGRLKTLGIGAQHADPRRPGDGDDLIFSPTPFFSLLGEPGAEDGGGPHPGVGAFLQLLRHQRRLTITAARSTGPGTALMLG